MQVVPLLTLVSAIFIGAVLAEVQSHEDSTHVSRSKRRGHDSANCDTALGAISQECLELIYNFDEALCEDTCGNALYEYAQRCDLNISEVFFDIDADRVLDFLCAQNAAGARCLAMLSDLPEPGDCENATSDYCPSGCPQQLRDTNVETDCCIFTAFAIDDPVETKSYLEECGVTPADSCIGGFSGNVIITEESYPTKKPAANGTASALTASVGLTAITTGCLFGYLVDFHPYYIV